MTKYLLIVAFSFSIFSCQQKENGINYAVISGRISNLESSEINLIAINGEFNKKIPLNENGSFRDTLKTFPQVPHRLTDGSNYTDIYLEEGYDISLTYDAKDHKNTLIFTGNGAALNNYLMAKSIKSQEIWGNNVAENYGLEESLFRRKMEKMGQALKKMLDDAEGIPEEIKEMERRSIDHQRLAFYSSYIDGAHAELGNNPDYKASAEFTWELDNLNYTLEDDFNYSRWYRSLARRHFADKATKLAKKDSLDRNTAFFRTMEGISSDDIRNALLFNGVKYSLAQAEDMDEYYLQFMQLSSNPSHKEEITNTYEQLKKIAPGAPSPRFTNYENHAGGTTSLSNFKGKYVYIDVWATWCQPCIVEIPALQEVERSYRDRNIAFVSISIDRKKDHDTWRTMVTEKTLGGVQLLADKAWDSQFVQDYRILGIPRFILIDPEGNIVDENAPGPSSPKLKAVLDALNL